MIEIPKLFGGFFANFSKEENENNEQKLRNAMKPYLERGWIDNSFDIVFSVRNPQTGDIQVFDWTGRHCGGTILP
jgi:hypothetical protein